MRRLATSLAATAITLFLAAPGLAEAAPDYRGEMLDHVFRPCFMVEAKKQIRESGNSGVSAEKIVELLILTQKDSINKTIRSAILALKDRDYSGRMMFYPMALDTCLRGMV